MKDKKLLLIVLVMVLFVSIGKETYALFTNEVSSIVQSYSTGTLKLSYSNASVNLDNAYPLTDKEGMNQDVNTITITNVGTLAYKFNVIIDPSSDSTISSDLIRVSMDGENPATLSTDSNIIIRDVILNPGSSRTFTIKLWINSNTSSSDILNKKFSASLTSTGIAVKDMEDSDGIVLVGEYTGPLYDYIKNRADTTTQIDFSKTSEISGTNGIYMTTDTDSGNPVYYYRGNVENHVLFANFCWRIVRTTETGGVKLIYNGVQKDVYETTVPIEESSYINVTNDATYPYTFDSTNKTWTSTNKTNSATGTLSFSVATAGNYVLSYAVSSERGYDKALFYKNGTKLEEHSGTEEGTISLSGLTTTDIIKVEYTKDSVGSSGSDTVIFNMNKAVGEAIKSCNNTGDGATIGKSAFNSSSGSPADIGYMYGTRYTYKSKPMSSLSGSIVFGNDITYANGVYTLKDTYTLTDASNWSSEYSTIASKYHYTCFTSNDTCTKVNYIHEIYYNTSRSTLYYFELSGGKNHLDILKEMLDNSTNTNSSKIKTTIDTWYKNNMINYTSQLEDTVFCNDRSYDVSKSGWNKDYSNRGNPLHFNSYQRMYSSYKPTLMCANTNDKFTTSTSNGNGVLDYPVGLLTVDETMYAGTINSTNISFYLYTGQAYSFLSPWGFESFSIIGFGLNSTGGYSNTFVNNSYGVRPVLALKSGTEISGGSGTATDPFIVN